MNRLKRVAAALRSKTGDRIKDGWICGAKILSGRASGARHSRTKGAFHSGDKKLEDERNKEALSTAASDGVYGDETGRLIRKVG